MNILEEINKITRKDQHYNMTLFIIFEFRENMFRKLKFLFQKLILCTSKIAYISSKKHLFLNFEGFIVLTLSLKRFIYVLRVSHIW